uniref:FCH domain only protein 2 n=1 Tax=Lygus hesperus TaxID=30085 RepID=A0A0A9WQ60_LYGHE
MDQSVLSSAFYRVGLVADQTWWTEKDFSDDYKLASLGLWNEVINSNARLSNLGLNQEQATCKQNNNANAKSNEKQNTAGPQLILKKDKLLLPTCRLEVTQMQNSLASMDPTVLAPLPQSVLTDTRCILSAKWPIALLKTYPALTSTLKNNSTSSVFSNKHAIGNIYKDGNTLPYSIDTIDELMYHKKIASTTVKNVWSDNAEKTAFKKPVWDPQLNANVPEFYPSVLLPPRQCPPRYSNVFGANYQSEVFPYNDDKIAEKKEKVGEESVTRKKKNRRGSSEQRLTHQLQAAASSSSPNLLRSPKTCDSSKRTHSRENPRAEVNYWLQNVYPHRVLELSKFRTIARHIDSITHRIALPFPQVMTQPSPPAPFTPSSERRLYRDVLARKVDDAVDRTKDESEQNPFDELERQALEQYQSSETCLVQQGTGNDINPDPDDSKFQDLEREALEQYTEDGDDQIERNLETPIIRDVNAFAPDSKPRFENCGGINLNQLILLKSGSSDRNNPGKIDRSAPDEYFISPESIVKSVVGDEKSNDEIYELPQANEVLSVMETRDAYIESSGMAVKNRNRAKKNMKKRTKRQGEEESKFGANKPNHDKLRSFNNAISYQIPNVLNIEEETRRLASNLKHKVLTYLRNVNLKKIKELDENRRPNVKHQISKDQLERPIQERVKVSDIDDLDTYRSYIREISTKARSTLLLQFKRIRSEIMESTSRGIVPLVSPTTSEKRRVRQIIKKCLELKNHADKTPRNPLNGVKREVMDTLEIVHNTMEVIYALSNLSKEAFKDVEFLKNGRTLAAELYVETTTLEDKSDYVKQRVMVDERSVLLVVLFPRVPGVLYDRCHEESKKKNCRSIYYDHDLLRINYTSLFKNFPKPSEFQVPKMDHSSQLTELTVHNIFKFTRVDSKSIWDPNNWSHIYEVGRNRRRVILRFSSTGRQAEAFCRVLTKLPPLPMVSKLGATTAHSASPRRKRMSSTLSNNHPNTRKKTGREVKTK